MITVGPSNDFRVILPIVLAWDLSLRVIGYGNSSMPSKVEFNTLYCSVSAGVKGGAVLLVGVIQFYNSRSIPLETLWHYGWPRFAGRISTSTKTRDQLPRYSGYFLHHLLKMTRCGKEKEKQFLQSCQDESSLLFLHVERHVQSDKSVNWNC